MARARAARGTARIWRILLLSQLREQPGRLLVTLLAIALGVALASSVFLVNSAALTEFSQAAKRLVGEADVIVRGPRDGFPEALFARLASDPRVAVASPVLELEAALPGRRETLKILGIDPLRAAALQPATDRRIGADLQRFIAGDGIYLSAAAADELQLRRGDRLQVTVGNDTKRARGARVRLAAELFAAARLDRYRGRPMDVRTAGAAQPHRPAPAAGRRRRSPAPRAWQAIAGRRARRDARSRARPRGHGDARLPREPQYARASGALDRRLSGVLDPITVGACAASNRSPCCGRSA